MRPRHANKPAERSPGDRPWSAPVAIAEVSETGRHVDLTPDAATREALARMAGVLAFSRIEASFDLNRVGRDGLRVIGRVSATVEQTCVVTLDPVSNEIDETVDLVFVPPAAVPRSAGPAVVRALDADEPPEVLREGVVDLGEVATEHLILGIDPYPRKIGAAIDAPPPAAADASPRPFAALAALKKENGGTNR
jgi:uncharacterized metal-binding protein YceD (DUF177 family)